MSNGFRFDDNTEEGYPSLVQSRPFHGWRQIRNVSDIIPGKYYVSIENTSTRTILVLKKPQNDLGGNLYFMYMAEGDPVPKRKYCSDAGVISNNRGLWNSTNCLKSSKKKRLTNGELRELLLHKLLERLDLDLN